MKRGERIALSLRTDRGVPVDSLARWSDDVREFVELGLMRESGGAYRLTRSGKLLADSVAEAFV
jgi:oxygen-independent coproporphyrinogen-3 oxidase